MKQMTTGQYLTQLLSRYGVDCVFGIPGVHTLELYRSLTRSKITHITPRHEQGAGFMADGYARVCKKPGVVFSISGPGISNLLTAMGQAYGDSIPMLVISTVNAHGRMGSGDGWLHELPDQQALVRGVCAFSHTVHDARELPQVVARAFAVFDSMRPRPVHIELPVNVLCGTASMALPERVPRLHPPAITTDSARSAARSLSTAQQPVILAGGGSIGASNALTKLAEKLAAPVIMTVNARGTLPANHPLAIQASPSLGDIRQLINQADVVFAVGTELGSTDYDFYEDGQFDITGLLIRLDIDPEQIMRNQLPDIGLVGDAAASIEKLLLELAPLNRSPVPETQVTRVSDCNERIMRSVNQRDRQYLQLLNNIRRTLPGAVIVGDSTQIIYAGNTAFSADKPRHYFNSATGFGTLGYALPASIGAALANRNTPVVAIAGDGGLQFSLSEFATATDADITLTLIVHANGGYGEIKTSMIAEGIEPVGVDLMVPDFLAIATAYRWRSIQLLSLDELPALLLRIQDEKQSTMVIIPDELFTDTSMPS